MKSHIATSLLALTAGPLFGAISTSSINTFDTDTEGWTRPRSSEAPTFTANPSFDGQPGYLINRSTASGAGNRWNMRTTSSTWTGDYLGANVGGISLWADNRSGVGTTIDLRLAFNGAGGWFITDAIAITDSIVGNEWTLYQFDLSSLTHVAQGSGLVEDTLSNVTAFQMLVAEDVPSRIGGQGFIQADSVPSTDLRFDNISATAIPEPSALILSAVTLIAGASRRRR